MDFNHQTVVVTGAAGNLGRAVAQAFASVNANRVLVDLRDDLLAAQFGADDDRQLLIAADLTHQSEATAIVNRTITRFQRIDVLCNVAGGFRMGSPVHETTDETFQLLFDLNVRSMVNMVRAAVPAMLNRGSGAIVNVGAFAAQKGVAGMGAYCASKAVVIRLTEAMADELRDRNIRVNCVLPTTLDTPANRTDMPGADPSKWVAPDDLAQTIMFLASPAARAIHGASLAVRGRV